MSYYSFDLMAYNVNLPQVYEKLILSDFEFSKNNKDKDTIIINLCMDKLESEHNNFIYNFNLLDSEEVPYHNFKDIISQCVQLIYIAEQKNYPIIVNCAAGINRSCSVIVAYSISKGLGIDDTIEYIKHEKRKKYRRERWSTLTNQIFVNHLRRIKSEK